MQRTPKRGCRRPKETPKEKEGDEEVGKAAVMMNGEGAQRKFWRNGEENPRQGEDRGMIGGGQGGSPPNQPKDP